VTRDDLRRLLDDDSTRLAQVVVSEQSGFDESTQRRVGERHDYVVGESDQNDSDTVVSALQAVQSTLQQSADAE
jgi:hypothetical protein